MASYDDARSYFSDGFTDRLEDPAEYGRQLFEHRMEADYIADAITELARFAQNRKRYRKVGGRAARTLAGETIFELLTTLADESGVVSYGKLVIELRRRHKMAGSRNGRVFAQLEEAGAIIVRYGDEFGRRERSGEKVTVELGAGIDQPPVEFVYQTPVEDEPAFEYEWRYSMNETGGEKWQLLRKTSDPRAWSERIVATMIRLPGSMTRIYRVGDGRMSDHPAPLVARLALERELGVELPKLPGRSDAAHERGAWLDSALRGHDYTTNDDGEEPRDVHTGERIEL